MKPIRFLADADLEEADRMLRTLIRQHDLCPRRPRLDRLVAMLLPAA